MGGDDGLVVLDRVVTEVVYHKVHTEVTNIPEEHSESEQAA